MAKLPRYLAKIFGTNASTDQMAEVGSFAAGAPLTYDGSTITPDIVQALSNYLTGLFSITVGNNSPFIEDFNSLFYLFSYQLAYGMQAGIPEWNTDTIYFIGSLVNDSNGFAYVSLTDNNTGNALTDVTKWAQQPLNGAVTPLSISNDVTIATGKCLTWPTATVATGKTVTISTGANYVGVTSLTLSGTAVFTLAGTAVGRIL